MLSLFPTFLAFGLFAPFLIRLTVGLYFLWYGRNVFREGTKSKTLFFFYTGLTYLSSLSILAGVYTQLGGVLLALLSFILYIQHNRDARFFFLGILSLSLLFLGAGFFAFDLPI